MVRDVSVSGFSTTEKRAVEVDHAYFHQNHVPPGYRMVSTPPTWERDPLESHGEEPATTS